MDNRVRDLDQIQELESDEPERRLGTIVLAAAAIVGLTLAVGVVVGRAAEPSVKVDDPLAKLERTAAATTVPRTKPETAEPQASKVEVADLSFPSTLSEDEDRPEVLDALRAARAEAAELAQVEEPKPLAKLEAQRPAIAATADDDDEDGDLVAPKRAPAPAAVAVAAPPDEVREQVMVASVPAAVVAASSTRNLRKAARHDPLVAAAVRAADDGGDKSSAPHGHDGEYTLQVISFDRAEPSRAFADRLREKGHAAFVASAEIEGRGHFFRVRIGPFKSREQAEAYRHKFEEDEHMNTFVVHEKVEKRL